MTSVLPQLVIFDLDFTLWMLYLVPKHYKIQEENKRIWEYNETRNMVCNIYPEVPLIFDKLKSLNISIAIASYCIVENLNDKINTLGWDKYISFREIYYDSQNTKTIHFNNIRKKSKVSFNEMMFFDDQLFLIESAKKLGIFGVHVNSTDRFHGGMKMKILNDALRNYKLLKQRGNELG